MEVIRAERAGFCMGVSLAIKKLERAIAGRMEKGSRICTLGPIIHNPRVMADFRKQGVSCLDDARMAESGDYVLIRAHGITRQEERALKGRCAHVEDATCPKVKKAQLAIAEATASGATLILFGEADHPEVRGLVSYAAADAHVAASLAEIMALNLDVKRPHVLASQTTQDREAFSVIASHLEQSLPRLEILNTICDATRERQQEALRIASQVDVMVVVGGLESGNTRRLAQIARQVGIPAFHVEDALDLVAENISPSAKVGLTAGASTPKSQIDSVEQWLLNHK